LGIGWVLVGYWLGIGWVLVGYWLGIGWVLVGYWLGIGLAVSLINTQHRPKGDYSAVA
jgi:hypothetical protein